MYTAAVIGTGFISAKNHLPAWMRLQRKVKVVAVCDLDRDRAETVSRTFGIPAVYTDVQQMLETERPDFVDICTPPSTHANIAVAALKADSHVLIEKPMAMNVEECDAIIRAERESTSRVEVAHTDLFHPSVTEAQNRIKRGDIGDFTGMRIFYCTPVTLNTTDPDHFANRLPGGAIGETGPHVVYLTQAFVGHIRDVWVQGQKLLPEYPWSPFEDYRLELAGDRTSSSVVLTFTSRHSGYWVELWGTEGVLKIDMQSKVLVDYRRVNQSPWGIGFSAFREAAQIASGAFANGTGYLTGRFRNTHDRLVQGFFQRGVEGLAPVASAEDGRNTVQVMGTISERLQSRVQ